MPSAAAAILAALPALVLLSAPEPAAVEPPPPGSEPSEPAKAAVAQYNASVIVSGVGAHDDRGWSGGAQLGLRPELILGRKDGHSLGGGPYLEANAHLASRGVAGLFGAGASLLVPLGDSNALVPSVGAYGTYSEALRFQPGVGAGLFFGARLFNHRTFFDGAWGVRLDVRYGLGSAHEAMASVGMQFDLSLAAFLLTWMLQ